MSLKKIIFPAGILLLVLFPPVAAALDQSFYTTLVSRILIYALAAVSLDLILGFGGMVSLCHAAFMGVGAYAVGILAHHATYQTPLLSAFGFTLTGTESALVAWPLAVVSAGLLSILIGAVSLRTKGVYFIMITLAFSQMIHFLFVSLEKYGGDDGMSLLFRNSLPGVDPGNDATFYYICLVSLFAFLFFCRRLVRSRFGMIIQGCRENESRMTALGVPTYRYKLACFVIAGAGAGLAGALMANQIGFISPGLMHWTVSGEIVIMVVLGGIGTLTGPALGAAVLILLEEIFSMYTEHWMLFLGPSLILLVLYARQGIFGALTGKDLHHG
ncbi:MAG: branched-chain amino acid ABC transporter permease [Desulfovibrionales bacterium]